MVSPNCIARRSWICTAGQSHALRHIFATRYRKANIDDLRGLVRLLGHSSLDTVKIYTEPGLDDLTQRMERIEIAGI